MRTTFFSCKNSLLKAAVMSSFIITNVKAASFDLSTAGAGSNLAATETGNVLSGGNLNAGINIVGNGANKATLNVKSGGQVTAQLSLDGNGVVNINQGGTINVPAGTGILGLNTVAQPIEINLDGELTANTGIDLNPFNQNTTVTMNLTGKLDASNVANTAFRVVNNANITLVFNINSLNGSTPTVVGIVEANANTVSTLNINTNFTKNANNNLNNFDNVNVTNAVFTVDGGGITDQSVLNINSGAEVYIKNGTFGSANLSFNANQLNGRLNISDTGQIVINNGNALTVAGTGSLNLTARGATYVIDNLANVVTNNGLIVANPNGTERRVRLNVTNLSGNGKYKFGVNGSLQDESAYLQITGNANTDGSTIEIDIANGTYVTNNQTLDVIRGGGAANLGTVTLPKTAVLSYSAAANGNNIRVTATRTNYKDLLDDGSAKLVGDILNTKAVNDSDLRQLTSVIDVLTDQDSVQDIFREQVVPERHNGTSNFAQSFMAQGAKLATDRMELVRSTPAYVSGDDMPLSGSWVKFFTSNAKQKKRKNIEGYNINAGGAGFGIDRYVADKLMLGIGFGYAKSDIESRHFTKSSTTAESFLGMIYAGYEIEKYNVDGSVSWASNHYRRERNYIIGDFSKVAKSKNKGHQYGFNLNVGYSVKHPWLDINPKAILNYAHSTQNPYTESIPSAPNLAQYIVNDTVNTLNIGAGVKFSKRLDRNNVIMVPNATFKIMYDVMGDAQESTVNYILDSSATFSSKGPRPAKYSFGINLGVNMMKYEKWDIGLNYDLLLKERYMSNGGYLTIRYTW